MTARLSHLEKHYSRLSSAVASTSDTQGEGPPRNRPRTPDLPRSIPSQTITDEQSPHSEPRGASSILLPIATFNRTARRESDHPASSHSNSTFMHDNASHHSGTPSNREAIDLANAERAVWLNNGASFRPSFDILFQHLNPHQPLINENQFRSQFDDLVFNGGNHMSPFDRYQFLALVYLVRAEIKLLNGNCSDPNTTLGWEDFYTADGILGQMEWPGEENVLSIQCLLLKARFLLYLERFSAAYNTMGAAVRLCFQIGLHNQPAWNSLKIDEFELHMRQRVFWSVFTLDRAVSLNCGFPYLLRVSDFNVGLPKPLDDRSLFPNRPLPNETPECSSIPYMLGLIRWGYLCGEIWDSMFSVTARKPSSEPLVASFDDKILLTIRQLPPHLQWRPGIQDESGVERAQVYVRRQIVLSHLVCQNDPFQVRVSSDECIAHKFFAAPY